MNKDYGWWLPVDISTHGGQIDLLIVVIHIIMAVLFVGWFCFLVHLIWKFRARPGHKAEYHTKHFKAPTYLEVAVALTEVVLLFAFSFPIWKHYTQELPPRSESLVLRVVAEQFAWNIHYPGADGVPGKSDPKLMNAMNPLGLDPEDPAGKDDVSTINELVVPEGKPVIIELTSKDVIHSFFLPVARVKQDAIPGQRVSLWFEAKRTGDFEIACAQLCGLGHYRMKGAFLVKSKPDFETWMGEQIARKMKA